MLIGTKNCIVTYLKKEKKFILKKSSRIFCELNRVLSQKENKYIDNIIKTI